MSYTDSDNMQLGIVGGGNAMDMMMSAMANSLASHISASIGNAIEKAMSESMAPLGNQVGSIEANLSEFKSDIVSRVTNLEENEAFSEAQVNQIDNAIELRTNELLGITIVNGRPTEDCLETYQRYHGALRRTILAAAKRECGVPKSKKWMYTSRKNFARFLDVAENYQVRESIESFKSWVDKRTLENARRKAQIAAQLKIEC